MEKIAVFRASRIGDFLCATPGLRSLRRTYPQAQITYIGLPIVRELADRCMSIDRFWEFPGYPGIAEQFFRPELVLEFLDKSQKENFDLVIQMHGSGVFSNPLVLMMGGKKTAMFVRESEQTWAENRALITYEWRKSEHEVVRVAGLLKTLGVLPAGFDPEIGLLHEDHDKALKLLSGLRSPLIGVHPGGRTRSKRWCRQGFEWVARELIRVTGGTILLLGGMEELDSCREIESVLGRNSCIIAGEVPLPVMGAVISRLSLLVTNDSGPAHMAYALKTPCVTIFGGTERGEWGPLVEGPYVTVAAHADCRPCDTNECLEGWRCLSDIQKEEVLYAALAIFQQASCESTLRLPKVQKSK
jgi:ADP-heptose:LPS heptosyltransferase